ncbi:MAG: hypothetical protein ACR2IY_09215, partial [Rubrivivax sp.]
MGQADHGIERGAQLVAHAGEEVGLRPCRALRPLQGLHQLLGAPGHLVLQGLVGGLQFPRAARQFQVQPYPRLHQVGPQWLVDEIHRAQGQAARFAG